MANSDNVRHVVIYVDHNDGKKSKSSPVRVPPSPSGHCEVFEERKATPGVQAGVAVLLALNALYFCAALVFSQNCHSICLLIDAYQSFFITASLFIHMLDFKIPTRAHGESSTRQTFSWGRVRLLGQMSNMIFLLSLMFSQLVEAGQTMVHTSHLDALHRPTYVLAFGFTKFCLSLLTFIVLRATKVHQLSQPPHMLLLERRPRINSDVSFSSRTMRFRNLSGHSASNMEINDKERTLSAEKSSNDFCEPKNVPPVFTDAVIEHDPLDKLPHETSSKQPVELEALLSPAACFGADKADGVPNTPPSTVTSDDIHAVIKRDDNTTITDTSSFSTPATCDHPPTTPPNRTATSSTRGIIDSLPPPAPPRVDAALYDGTNANDVVVQRNQNNAVNRKSGVPDGGDVLADDFVADGSEELSKNPYIRDQQNTHFAESYPQKEPPVPQTRKFCSNSVFDSLYVALNKWLNFISPLAVIASACAILYWQPEVFEYVKLADPIIALFLIAAIGMAIVPSATELIFHLLLTVPKDIFAAGGVHRLRECVREQYPIILDIHSLRVWRHDPYNPASIVFTCHIVLEKPSDYAPAFADELQRFIASLLGAYRATCMTIQPEFYPLARALVVAQNKRYPCQSVCCEQSIRAKQKQRRRRTTSKQRNAAGKDVERSVEEGVSGASDNEQHSLGASSPQQRRSIAASPTRGRNKSGSSKLSTGAAPTSLETSDLELAPLFSYSTYFRDQENEKEYAKSGISKISM